MQDCLLEYNNECISVLGARIKQRNVQKVFLLLVGPHTIEFQQMTSDCFSLPSQRGQRHPQGAKAERGEENRSD